MTRIFLALATAAALLLGVASASAAPLSPAPAHQPAAAESLAEPVHGCHRNVELGPAGWHYHSGPGCRRVSARDPRGYRGYDGPPRHRRGPVCYQECKYIGPIKTCKTRCR